MAEITSKEAFERVLQELNVSGALQDTLDSLVFVDGRLASFKYKELEDILTVTQYRQLLKKLGFDVALQNVDTKKTAAPDFAWFGNGCLRMLHSYCLADSYG